MSARPPEQNQEKPPGSSRLRTIRMGRGILALALAGSGMSGIGLLVLTGLAPTPWLFLLYPVLIGCLMVSLSAMAMHLLHRF